MLKHMPSVQEKQGKNKNTASTCASHPSTKEIKKNGQARGNENKKIVEVLP